MDSLGLPDAQLVLFVPLPGPLGGGGSEYVSGTLRCSGSGVCTGGSGLGPDGSGLGPDGSGLVRSDKLLPSVGFSDLNHSIRMLHLISNEIMQIGTKAPRIYLER